MKYAEVLAAALKNAWEIKNARGICREYDEAVRSFMQIESLRCWSCEPRRTATGDIDPRDLDDFLARYRLAMGRSFAQSVDATMMAEFSRLANNISPPMAGNMAAAAIAKIHNIPSAVIVHTQAQARLKVERSRREYAIGGFGTLSSNCGICKGSGWTPTPSRLDDCEHPAYMSGSVCDL